MGLVWELDEWERVEADDGYMAECPDWTRCPGACRAGSYLRTRMEKRVRLRQETVNERFKNFGCMDRPFKQSVAQHSACFRSIVVLTQLAMESGESLFDAREYNDAHDDAYVRNHLQL